MSRAEILRNAVWDWDPGKMRSSGRPVPPHGRTRLTTSAPVNAPAAFPRVVRGGACHFAPNMDDDGPPRCPCRAWVQPEGLGAGRHGRAARQSRHGARVAMARLGPRYWLVPWLSYCAAARSQPRDTTWASGAARAPCAGRWRRPERPGGGHARCPTRRHAVACCRGRRGRPGRPFGWRCMMGRTATVVGLRLRPPPLPSAWPVHAARPLPPLPPSFNWSHATAGRRLVAQIGRREAHPASRVLADGHDAEVDEHRRATDGPPHKH